MDLMYQGVATGQISLSRWVELTSTTPARMFGLYGKKGVIQPGADADLVIYDPAGHTSIGYQKTHHMNMDYSAWEGFEIDGHVDWVMSRGTVLVDDSGYVGSKGHGQYLRPQPVSALRSDHSPSVGNRAPPSGGEASEHACSRVDDDVGGLERDARGEDKKWSLGLSCKPTLRRGVRSSSLSSRRHTASTTCGRSTRTCCGRSPT